MGKPCSCIAGSVTSLGAAMAEPVSMAPEIRPSKVANTGRGCISSQQQGRETVPPTVDKLTRLVGLRFRPPGPAAVQNARDIARQTLWIGFGGTATPGGRQAGKECYQGFLEELSLSVVGTALVMAFATGQYAFRRQKALTVRAKTKNAAMTPAPEASWGVTDGGQSSSSLLIASGRQFRPIRALNR